MRAKFWLLVDPLVFVACVQEISHVYIQLGKRECVLLRNQHVERFNVELTFIGAMLPPKNTNLNSLLPRASN